MEDIAMSDMEKVNSILESLKRFDTPTITNVVATYPAVKKFCLGLYHPWKGNWYTDQSLRCMFPEIGRTVGYVVTCVYGMPDPGFNNLGFLDILKAIKKSPKPVILAVKQNFPEEIKRFNGLLGGNMMTAFKSAGVSGVISDGPSRDIDEIRPMGIQYMLTGVCAGHGDFSIHAVDVPVEICGMSVAPGDIVHMDENGAVKFPYEYIGEVAARAEALQKIESEKQRLMREATDIEELGRIMSRLFD